MTLRFARAADRLAAVLGTRNDVLLFGAEAMLALEAVATSLAAPHRRVVNVVTSPYGGWFGAWLTRGGAQVLDVRPADPRRPIAVAEVAGAIAAHRPEIVVVVHGEASTGVVNPIADVARAAREAGAIVVVDAVASIGGHRLETDAWDLDVVALGPQKALGGPVSLSAVAVSDAAWRLVAPPTVGAPSALSLADLHRDWIATGRGPLPGTPDPAVFDAFDGALDALEAEGLEGRIVRHAEAAARARDGVRALGHQLWIDDDADASHLVTTVALPRGVDPAAVLTALTAVDDGWSAGVGDDAPRFLRLNHTADRAAADAVRASLDALRSVLG